MTGVSMSTNQFEENVNKSKESVGEIVDEEIRSSSPDLPSEPWTFSEDQVAGFRENLNGILNSMARITPRMATNPDAIAFELAKFVGRLINSEWAEVKVGHESIASVIREAATYRTPVDIPPPPPVKNVLFAPTPIPTSNAPTPMDVDATPSPARIPAALKGKGKAPPPHPTPQHPDLEIQYVHPVNRGTPTRIPDDANSRASVIDLVAASAALINQEGFHYKIKVDDRERWRSDHRPLQIEVPILGSEPEMRCKRKIEAWSEEEDDYVAQICGDLGRMTDNVSNSAEELETTMGRVSTAFERAWEAYLEERKPSRHGKKWWNEDCKKAYQEMGENGGPRNREMRNKMRKTLRAARRQYFDKQIHNMASDRKRPWDLMPWTRERKMPAVEAILDSEGNSCNTEDKLFETLHNTYNAADNREVDVSSMYREIEEFEEREW
ncbi:hypothetical protein AGABI1DRAFT_134096, partial [Agaricus bisporus var. burnettii JB137-S8]